MKTFRFCEGENTIKIHKSTDFNILTTIIFIYLFSTLRYLLFFFVFWWHPYFIKMSIFSLKNYSPNINWYNFGDHWMLNIFVISNPPAKKVSLAPLYKLHWQLIWHGLVLKVKVVSENIMWTFRNFCPIKHFVPHIKLLTQFVQVPLFNGFWLYIFILFYLKFFYLWRSIN